MRQRLLGRSGLRVSELCLGTGNFCATGVYAVTGALDQAACDHLVAMALDAGINFFNTAEIYSDGAAEVALGKALGKRRGEAVIITKVHPKRIPGYDYGHSRKHIIEGCEASLKRLGTEYIDVFELHFFDPDTPLEVTLRALDDLVRAGKVRYVGCSNFTGWQLVKGLGISERNGWERFTTLEAMYNLCCRELEYEIVPACIDQGVAFVPYSALHGGFLTGKYRRGGAWPEGTRFSQLGLAGPWAVEPEKLYDIVDALDTAAVAHEGTVSQASLNYLLRKPGVCSLIIGARNARQLEDNLKAMDWELTHEEFAKLDEISAPVRKYPYEIFDPLKAPPGT
jgi:aryl-alcohol dehydrogenase-like predicted oxidoreductase